MILEREPENTVTVQEIGPNHPEYTSLSKMHAAITNNHTPLSGPIKKYITKPKDETSTSVETTNVQPEINLSTPNKPEVTANIDEKSILPLDTGINSASLDTAKGVPVTPLDVSRSNNREKAEGSILSRIDKQVQSQFSLFTQTRVR